MQVLIYLFATSDMAKCQLDCQVHGIAVGIHVLQLLPKTLRRPAISGPPG